MTTLIHADQTWLLWTVILVGVALSIWLEQAYAWAAHVGGPLLLLGTAMILANLRIMPPQAAVYDVVQDDLVPLALPLLLLRADIFHIIRTTGWLLFAFHFASLGTVLGAIGASLLLSNYIADVDQTAAIMTASYIGGAVNFFAVARSYETSVNVTGPLLVADNFIMAGVFMILLALSVSRWAKQHYRHPHTSDAVDSRALAEEHWKRKEIGLFDIAAALAVGVTIVTIARGTSSLVQAHMAASLLKGVLGNLFVHITFWSTLAATLGGRWLVKIHGVEEMGGYLLYVFLFVIGLPADLYEVFTSVPMMFLFCAIIAGANIVVMLIAGRIFRLNLEDMILAVNASIGGPPTAAAMAIAKGWSKLVLPGLLVGIYGYMIGTAVGLTVGDIVRMLVHKSGT